LAHIFAMTDDGFERTAIVVMASGVGVVFAAVTLGYVPNYPEKKFGPLPFLPLSLPSVDRSGVLRQEIAQAKITHIE
jgi:hypothetical protein